MENLLVKYVSKSLSLSVEEINAIEQEIVIRDFRKGTILLREGEVSTRCYFNLKGLVRQYYLVDGEEKTTAFFAEEQAVNSFESASQRIPSKHYLACVEDCTLVVGDLSTETDFLERFPRLEILVRMMVDQDFGKQQEMLASYIITSPEERYLKLLESPYNLIQRVPQYQLAGYLGITPESLSRIRKRILVK
ncbi:cyclic nucleotide-binding domain-containing protein [Emticicia sp. CRIBPO]|uniref:Crp/Fnr family transcriptional regulator n=1 Tax=Emticicia sp. CRIBPO TaxID=2683258 RepID=UPI0014131443|nr:Crp/Fnr family transcriptional regulator [Emticicia sp. CRIBPO]NBA84802.1 cyclic nucleotide-binding domain-containing protein [Emticicia sp. CRIBPO]